MTPPEPLVTVRDLTVATDSGVAVVTGVSLTLGMGATLGLVGESGSGKTTTALALLGFARAGMRIVAGEITIQGQRMALHEESLARRQRGKLVAHVPQDPTTSLNPSLRVARAIADVMEEHRPAGSGPTTIMDTLGRVHLPATRAFGRRYPHQLSGGQQQRVLIACALACRSPLIVLDEPTTGLDVVTQARILAEIDRLHREQGVAMVYVSHDLAVVSQIADTIAVMYGGVIVEHGASEQVLTRPRHPYTRGLAASIPDHRRFLRLRGIPGVAAGPGESSTSCPFVPRCPQRVARCAVALPELEEFDGREVRCFEAARTPPLDLAERVVRRAPATEEPLVVVDRLRAVHRDRSGAVVAADGISFALGRGECVALVGESGSGKTTIARCIAGLHPPAAGRILLGGQPLQSAARDRPRELRRRLQIIFQNPYESLNPRKRVLDEVARPASVLRRLPRYEARAEATDLLARVRLPNRLGTRYPGELSGGERQRVAIARALSAQPEVLICDEITSALDVSVQAAVVDLLHELRQELSLSLLFITHNLGVVASIADRVLILDRGAICERGDVEQVFRRPESPRTKELLEAAPTIRLPAHTEAVPR